MLLTEKIKVKISKANIAHYKNKGYDVQLKDIVEIKTLDLTVGSHAEIQVICDYCGEKLTLKFKTYFKQLNKNIIKDDTCVKCGYKKREKILMIEHGVTNVMHLESTKENFKNTMMNKYGVINYSQTKEHWEKVTLTMMKKHGVSHYSKTDEFKEKTKKTSLIKFGVEHYSQSKEYKNRVNETSLKKYGTKYPVSSKIVREKIENTNMKKIGVKYPMQNEEISKKAFITMYNNGTSPCSKQQLHIHNLIGGELNKPIGRSVLDICFPKDMIYFEYDGGGHELSVLFGNITKKEFELKERKRSYYLSNNGWKELRLICIDDNLPDDDNIINFINISKKLLINYRDKYKIKEVN